MAATTERVVNDPHTGLAINGVDPVAYFTDAAPLVGLPENEYRYAGVVWRFRNEGNRAAFMANPEVYMPRFGGYDAVAIGRALALPGNPLLWAIVGERLYLFYSEDARARFMANPDEAICTGRQQVARPGRYAGQLGSRAAPARSVRNRVDAARGIAPGDEARHLEVLLPALRSAAAAPDGVVTRPPAAATMAWPAAMSHSDVGARRG